MKNFILKFILLTSIFLSFNLYAQNINDQTTYLQGSFQSSNPVTVSLSINFPVTITVIPANGDTDSITFTAAGVSVPITGMASITTATTITLPSRVSGVTFTTNSGSGVDSFEIDSY